MCRITQILPSRLHRITLTAFCVALHLAIPQCLCFAQSSAAVNFNTDVLPILSRTCFACHGPDDQSRQAELRLDTAEGALRSKQPPIIPGNAAGSLLFQRITSDDPEMRMPPRDAKRQLTSDEIELLRKWIADGAHWDEHWSFAPLRPVRPPDVRQAHWPSNPIDTFILARLEQQQLAPATQALKETLLRRSKLDLIGLPPTPDERTAFQIDERPDAYERLVDQWLASPHFGERWGRHWLDAARYADSSGFEGDPPRTVWKYRDWVISAMNADLSFDQFVTKQLAGHLLPDCTTDDRIATGFLLNSQQDGGSEPARLDAVVDRVNTIGTVFLGLTVGCAQCHSHKFDPLSQQEYYSLFAFVNSADELKLEFASPDQLSRRDALAAQVASLKAERTEYASKIPADQLKADSGYQERTATIEQLTSRIPEFPSALVLHAAPPQRLTTLFVRGEFDHPGAAVQPNVPRVLPPLCAEPTDNVNRELRPASLASVSTLKSSESSTTKSPAPPNLLNLAQWLVGNEQPLTPRVTVNRMWQQLFGKGMVETENDFGTQGARPTHPQLLDWLATEFSHRGWHTKRLIRSIVTSATYRQSSNRRGDTDRIDPENYLLSRQSRLRVEAEVVRDIALGVSGLLSTKMGGPGVFPFQHDGIMLNRATPAVWKVSQGEDRFRRGMYTYHWRLTPHPQLTTFDAPDAITACTRRQPSNTPLQALALLNEPTFTEAAETLARDMQSAQFDSDAFAIEQAFVRCLARPPTPAESQLLTDLLQSSRSRAAASQSALEAVHSEERAWRQVARAILNLEELITRE